MTPVVPLRRHSSGAVAVRDASISHVGTARPWVVVYAKPRTAFYVSQCLTDKDVAMWEQAVYEVTSTDLLTPDVIAVVLEYPYVDPLGAPVRFAHCKHCRVKVAYDESITYGTTVHYCARPAGKTAVMWKPFQTKDNM